MEIKGNVSGISKFWLSKIEKLTEFTLQGNQIVSKELADELAVITANINKEILLYVDRKGHINHVEVGDNHSVSLEALKGREAKSRLSGFRCIHTHPGGDGTLSMVDLTALPLLRFDCIVAIGVDAEGKTTNVGLAWGILGKNLPQPLLYPNLGSILNLDMQAQVSLIEKEAEKKLEFHEEIKDAPKALLVAISGRDTEAMSSYSLAELKQLADTAGLVVVDNMLQKRSVPDAATYIGKGKLEELRFKCQILGIDSIIFDDELSPVQIRNLEETTGKAIIDRSMLILDIFAGRAKSNEGKLQVELAQLRYMMPRLVGQGEVLSRLGGGIGTRGPGETKLEADRRNIRKRITELESRLEQVVKTRKLHREQRTGQSIPVIALVGYTNAGKSTLLNALTGSDVMAEDKLFATLDTTTRKITLPDNRQALLTDTVGFIRKLPHHLVAAFRATLEEVVEADLLVHVLDGSGSEVEEQVKAVTEVLSYLKAEHKPTVIAINKVDTITSEGYLKRLLGHYEHSVAISAKKVIGLAELLAEITEMLPGAAHFVKVLLPYSKASMLAALHNDAAISLEEYRNEGIYVEAKVDEQLYQRLLKAEYLVN